jgi:hypothetical protein
MIQGVKDWFKATWANPATRAGYAGIAVVVTTEITKQFIDVPTDAEYNIKAAEFVVGAISSFPFILTGCALYTLSNYKKGREKTANGEIPLEMALTYHAQDGVLCTQSGIRLAASEQGLKIPELTPGYLKGAIIDYRDRLSNDPTLSAEDRMKKLRWARKTLVELLRK